MTIMEMLERNSRLYGDDVALVEINPGVPETRRLSWRDYSLVQETEAGMFLTKRQTALQMRFLSAVSKKGTRLQFSL